MENQNLNILDEARKNRKDEIQQKRGSESLQASCAKSTELSAKPPMQRVPAFSILRIHRLSLLDSTYTERRVRNRSIHPPTLQECARKCSLHKRHSPKPQFESLRQGNRIGEVYARPRPYAHHPRLRRVSAKGHPHTPTHL